MTRFMLLFFIIMFTIGTDTFLVSPLLPTLQKEFNVSTELAGWMIGAYTLGSAMFALIAGPLSDSLNRRYVLFGGLLGFAASTILCGFANSFWSMCLFRFLAGVCAAFSAPQVWASIPAVMPASHISRAMGLAFSGLAAAQAMGVPIGSWLAVYSWSVPFWVVGGTAFVLCLVVVWALPNIQPLGNHKGNTTILQRYVTLLASGKARFGFLAYWLLHLGSGTTFAFVGKWLADQHQLSVGSIGTVMMFLGFGTLLGSLISARVIQAFGHVQAVAIGSGILMLLYIVGPYIPSLPIATSSYLVIFAILGILFPIVMEALTSLNASVRGTISSLANSVMNGANTVGAWVAGVLYVYFGGFASIGLFSSVCLALALLTFLVSGVFHMRAVQEP